jgi:hypothetical protein
MPARIVMVHDDVVFSDELTSTLRRSGHHVAGSL